VSKGVGRKFSRRGGAMEKRPKISKNTEKKHYLPLPREGGQRKKNTEK